jgi:uncharacterized protein
MDEPVAIDFARVAQELGLKIEQIAEVTRLLDEGNTVPFITRYRKERTGDLDEEQIRQVQQRVRALRQLAERAETILRLIDAQDRLAPELRKAIEQADKRLEDLYLPYRPKRRSRASLARERGLEPLALSIWNQDAALTDLQTVAESFVDAKHDLPTTAEVLQGAADILAERIGEDPEVRARCRRIAARTGRLTVTPGKQGEAKGQEYRDYFGYEESLSEIPPHRALALNRGEKAEALKVRFEWDDARALTEVLINLRLTDHRHGEFMQNCVSVALSRFLNPSLERELRRELTDAAEAHAVSVFARNLRNLLLQPSMSGQRVLAIDPGFRTGCKMALLDEMGNCLTTDVMYVTGSAEKKAAAKTKLVEFLKEHNCRIIAIGNGTACRETEEMISEIIAESLPDSRYLIVNEAGASIYSTSPVARQEFPDFDATVRGTVSIGRRLLDPLSELVKIDPQHIGVGMYQHDVSPKLLKESLDDVVESCVNFVGVDLNTASTSLLKHVSGLNQLIARRVVEWRDEHGRFSNRQQLRDVAGIGDATFTQAAGFLRITEGSEPLDETWIHPESYAATEKLLEKLSIGIEGLAGLSSEPEAWQSRIKQWDLSSLVDEVGAGVPTCLDILEALARPGRDPRSGLPGPVFKQGILKLVDLEEGMELAGTVLNVVDFGAFIDVGLKDSGLVHISKMSGNYISSPHDVVAVSDVVTVWVHGIDRERKRVSLTMIDPSLPAESKSVPRPKSRRKRKKTKPETAAPDST